jgi:uncharacterized Rmd1/YagE family protein
MQDGAPALALGARFEARAINIAERIDVRGIEPRLTPHPPVTIAAGAGLAMVFRSGVIVTFGADDAAQAALIAELAPRLRGRYEAAEIERATVRIGDADTVEPDAIVLRDASLERLGLVAEILAKNAVLAHNEARIGGAFGAIEPLALRMKAAPRRMPLKQRELVRHIGEAMLAEHRLVDRAEVLEKPDLPWDHPELDRLYARLEDEYEIRERHLIVDSKLAVVTTAARTMLELNQARRSYNVEWYIVALILFEIGLGLYELAAR